MEGVEGVSEARKGGKEEGRKGGFIISPGLLGLFPGKNFSFFSPFSSK